jgi:hypothetical protein
LEKGFFQAQEEVPGWLVEEKLEGSLVKRELLTEERLVESLVGLKLLAEGKMDPSLVKLELLLEKGMVESLVKSKLLAEGKMDPSLVKLELLLEKGMVESLVKLDLKHVEGKNSPQFDSPIFPLQVTSEG